MVTHVVLFTRDLRVDDNPALATACEEADLVVPVFVLDERILSTPFAAPNRLAVLHDALADLHSSLASRGGGLVVRHGDVAEEVAAVVARTGATAVHLARDVSRHAAERVRRIRAALPEQVTGRAHPGITVHPAGEPSPTTVGAEHYTVFTPYWRAWRERPVRAPRPAPDWVPLPDDVAADGPPPRRALVGDAAMLSPRLLTGGEAAAAGRADDWFDGGIEEYADGGHDDLSRTDGTSRLSADLHLGTISPAALVRRADRRNPGHDAWVRQVCWRDYYAQLLWANPTLPEEALRHRGDGWRDAPDDLAAWQEGRTGYPVVDAGMRQLRDEGWMHNRARLLVGTLLTKHLRIDWREGAAHFERWLVDGDLAANRGNWQWVAGVGTDSRPNRMANPWTQSRRYAAASYIRRHVPELATLDDDTIHAPHEAGLLADDVEYPTPIVDHAEARARFLAERELPG